MWEFIKKLLGFKTTVEKKQINLILFGPPGSGKGTQAKMLAEKFQLLHISTGDLFRYEMGNDTPLGLEAKSFISKGELVPDAITTGMLKKKLDNTAVIGGYIFDGYPRNTTQAASLEEILEDKGQSVTHLLALDVDDEEIVKRILKRGETSGRADDLDETIIRNRIDVYKSETQPVFDYFAEKDISKSINGVGSIDEIFERLSSELS